MAGQKMRPPFYRLHALTLNPATSMDDLAAALQATEAVTDRHRLSEGAVYASACRRWLLETGSDWRTTNQPDGAATWGGQSDHAYRLNSRPDGSFRARCSCGVVTYTFNRKDADDWHAAHLDALTDLGLTAERC